MTDGNRLYYESPPDEWVEALPVGSGRLGAMVFGHAPTDRLQFNEEHLWAGEGPTRPRETAMDHLAEVRELLLEGEHAQAHEIADDYLLGNPRRLRPYQSFGELSVTFPGHGAPANYRRELDLERGIASVRYDHDGTTFERTCFASRVDDVIVYRVTADEAGAVSLTAGIDREQDARSTAVDGDLVLRGRVIDLPESEHGDGGWGMRFEGRVRPILDGGSVECDEDAGELRIEDADAVTLLLAARTDHTEADPAATACADVDAAAEKTADALRADHVADHRSYFDRFSIDLGEAVEAPTDERLAGVADGEADPALAALYVQMARYLLISSSRPGGLPANLQGIWCEDMVPAWNSGFTTNLNLEMNYWSAEAANLGDCAEPLFDLIDSLRPSGRETARTHYDAEGWCAHHNTDLWGSTTPVDGVWGIWPLGGAWLCRHLWEHYEYTRDETFLAEDAYPVMKEAARFALEFLIEEDGMLHTAPSVSPENIFVAPDGHEGWLCVSPTIDVVILCELFANTIAAAETLDRDPAFRRELADAKDRLRPLEIGEDGRLLEWRAPYDEHYPGHRHLSHLYGSYPGAQITPRETPELAAATRQSIEYRLEHGSGSTGWSQAWLINQFARLEDPAAAQEHVWTLLGEYTADSMLDLHPPFQIDGNFGGAAGILECLVQSHNGELHVLPALPQEWREGSISGLRARGGFEVDLEWAGGTPLRIEIRSEAGERCRVRAPGIDQATVTEDGAHVDAEASEQGVRSFETTPDSTYVIEF